MVREAARERDLHRYYRPWLDAQSLINAADGSGSKGLTYDGYHPQNGRDRSLTAFAQLAALRLDARRAMVSLIDTHRQYILAEATRTVSLFTPDAECPGDEVWLGNAILNKFDAVCHYTFSSTYAAAEENGDTFEAECMVVPDCRLDPRFADKDYVKGEPGVRFYAGVPIVTRSGNRIGVYAVSDEKPRPGISAAELRFMQDVAAAVMEHLELAKDSGDRAKGERMVKGLTQFIELSAAQDPRENPASRSSTTMDRQTENARLQTVDEDDTPGPSNPPTTVKQAMRKNHCESDIARIFQRAARIIRESTDADGVVFFDTSAAGIQGQLHDFSRQAGSSDESATHNTTDFDTGDSTTSRRKRRQTLVLPEHSSEAAHAQSKACPVAGLALREGIAALVHADFAFTESGMERYIHRYPNGKFFNYNEEGLGVNSSDEKSQTSETDQSDRTQVQSTTAPKRSKKRREKFIPTEFLKVLPNVRTLIFLPLWDLSSERWVAGGFIWTTQAGRLMSPEHELPYLQAFGNSITSEVARLNTQKADKAKTTFIASISHELRSPLHGILGSVEFLRDTVSSTYQESLVSSIETCGRTLLDTIDHVLDYAKINKLRNATSRRKNNNKGSQKRPADNSILGVTADFDLAQLVEEVCDTVCAGHTFRKSQSANGGAIYDQAENTITNARVAQAGVSVSLIVAPGASWTVRSQPGALRRIVMNLLGNALKYTESGYIALKLQQTTNSQHGVNVTLAIEDSGRGMSADYQRTKLFSPFSQEDPFSSGTGLGLSIVKQIIESLKGEIEVHSTLNVGTEIKVSAYLPTAQRGSVEQDHVLRASNELHGLSACIVTEADACGGERGLKMKESMQAVCRGFNMKISGLANASISDVDILLTDSASIAQLLQRTDASRINRPPLCIVCICADAAEKATVESQHLHKMDSLGWIVEIFTQPCGPRKLVRGLMTSRSRATNQGADRHALVRSNTDQKSPSPELLTPPGALSHRSLSEVFPHEKPPPASNASGMPSPPLVQPLPTTITPLSPNPNDPALEYFSPRVLLVDDNAINLKLLVVFARRQNLRYSEAINGLEALETFKREAQTDIKAPVRPFDFVLMDLSMPIMDGLTSTRQIRMFEKKMGLQRSTIVALTGLASAQDQQDASDAGVDMYLVKPVKFADIRRIFGAK